MAMEEATIEARETIMKGEAMEMAEESDAE